MSTCPICKSPAYVGFTIVECSKSGCQLYPTPKCNKQEHEEAWEKFLTRWGAVETVNKKSGTRYSNSSAQWCDWEVKDHNITYDPWWGSWDWDDTLTHYVGFPEWHPQHGQEGRYCLLVRQPLTLAHGNLYQVRTAKVFL